MDRFGPTGKISKKLAHLSRWTTFLGRTGPIGNRPFHLIIPALSQSQNLALRYFLFNMEESVENTCSSNYQCSLCGWLTTDLSELLVHPYAISTGM